MLFAVALLCVLVFAAAYCIWQWRYDPTFRSNA